MNGRPTGVNLSRTESDKLDAAIAFAVQNGKSSYRLHKKLGVSSRTLMKHAAKLGLRFQAASLWTADEIGKLRRLALAHTASEIAEILGRSVSQVRNQAKYRRIDLKKAKSRKRGRPW